MVADSRFKLLLAEQEIEHRVEQIALELNRIYANKELTLIIVLKGAMCLASDLMRHLTCSLTLEMVQAASYGQKGVERGALALGGLEGLEIQGRDVLLIDHIYDSGTTLERIREDLEKKGPSSLRTLTLLCRKSAPKRPDYFLFEIDKGFVVGYGLDYKEHYRQLPAIYVMQ
jgi:hypoxanthine phosphoribosyltransferase